MKDTTYHRLLRVSVLVCALTLLFESGIISKTTANLSQNTHSYLASTIGMGASVKTNELNKFTAELTSQKTFLDQRENLLREREIELGLTEGENVDTNNEIATYILASLLFILLVLILLNYTLDYLRCKENSEVKTTV